jgi:hypothetical protein
VWLGIGGGAAVDVFQALFGACRHAGQQAQYAQGAAARVSVNACRFTRRTEISETGTRAWTRGFAYHRTPLSSEGGRRLEQSTFNTSLTIKKRRRAAPFIKTENTVYVTVRPTLP